MPGSPPLPAEPAGRPHVRAPACVPLLAGHVACCAYVSGGKWLPLELAMCGRSRVARAHWPAPYRGVPRRLLSINELTRSSPSLHCFSSSFPTLLRSKKPPARSIAWKTPTIHRSTMGNSYSGGGSGPAGAGVEVPVHLCFFLLVLLIFLCFSWYTSYESAAESFANQARILLMASPFALLLAVRLLSSVSGGEGRSVGDLLAVPMPERDSIHRAGGSPWGVGLLLVLLLVMVSYQSNFREKWFPLSSR